MTPSSRASQSLEGRLKTLREALLDDGRDVILESLLSAASARRQLPGRALSTEDLAYLRVKVSDEPGVLARVTRSASDLAVNIYDIEIAHGIEGVGGTLLLAVDAQQSQMFGDALDGPRLPGGARTVSTARVEHFERLRGSCASRATRARRTARSW